MTCQRLAVILTVLNFAVLLFVWAQVRPASAEGVAPVLRGRALEIVDEHGRVRAEIKVLPAHPTLKMPDGTIGYPEAVQLGLSSSQGDRNVKLVTTEDGSGLVLGGESGWVQLLSRRESPFVKLHNKDGREQTMMLQGSPTSK